MISLDRVRICRSRSANSDWNKRARIVAKAFNVTLSLAKSLWIRKIQSVDQCSLPKPVSAILPNWPSVSFIWITRASIAQHAVRVMRCVTLVSLSMIPLQRLSRPARSEIVVFAEEKNSALRLK